MAKDLKVPHLADGVDSAQVSEILVSVGDEIQEGDSVIAVDTDKASVEVPATEGGKIKEIKISEGDEVKTGDVIIILEGSGGAKQSGDEKESEEDNQDEEESQDEEEKKSEEKDDGSDEDDEEVNDSGEENKKDDESDENSDKSESESSDDDEEDEKKAQDQNDDEDKEKSEESSADKKSGKASEDKENGYQAVAAAPSVRRLARELGVDIKAISGSGKSGRISENDVKSFAENKGDSSAPVSKGSSGDLPDFSQWGNIETKPLNNIRKITARGMHNSWNVVPHVTQFDEADLTDLSAYQKKIGQKAAQKGAKITVTAILTKLAAQVLRQFPNVNASVDMAKEEMILKNYYHIGIAVDTPKGLLVPVIRDVDKKGLLDIALEIQELSEKARAGKLSREEMQGGTFTISNLGGIGGTSFTPIVYHPQVAILGVSRSVVKPVYQGEEFEPREIIPLSLSYDHRAIDGADGARFLRGLCDAIEDPFKALLGM